MSLLQKLLGTGKSNKTPSPQEAIGRLREVEEMLGKKQAFLEGKIDSELAAAKKHGTKNKRAALAALKRKKRLEQQLAQIDGTMTTLEFQRETLENASTNAEVLNVMSNAARALKAENKNMDVDKVHDLMDDIAEQQTVADEIAQAISQPVGMGEVYDEDELLAELDELEAEDVEADLLNIGPSGVDALPSVPDNTLSEPATEHKQKPAAKEDKDLEELAAWAD